MAKRNKEVFLDFSDFKKKMKTTLYLEMVFIEYDSIPLLCVCIDDENNRYFCHCTEIRHFEKWIIYPVNTQQLLNIVKKEQTIAEALVETPIDVIVYTVNWESGHNLFEKTSSSNLSTFDELPKGEYLPIKDQLSVKYAEVLEKDLSKECDEIKAFNYKMESQNIIEILNIPFRCYVDVFRSIFVSDDSCVEQEETDENIFCFNKSIYGEYAKGGVC